MKKILLLLLINLLLDCSVIAQGVSVNVTGAAPDASAVLDVSSTDKGMLVPRLALSATNVATPVAAPQTSLLVYNTATAGTGATQVTPGYYFWDGSQWVPFVTGSIVGTDDQTLTLTGTNLTIEDGNSIDLISLQDGDAWGVTGEDITSNVGRTGSVGIGTTTPSAPLDLAVTGETAIEFDNGHSIISVHDGHGNFNIKTGVDDDNKIVAGGGGSYISMAENGGIILTIDETTSVGGNFSSTAYYSLNADRHALIGGNVGLGTTAPTKLLDVAGQARVRNLPAGAATDGVLTTDANGNLRQRTLASIQDGTGTDDQTLTFTGTNLTIEDGNTVNLSSLQDGTGTDDQNLTGATLTGTTLQIDIENGTSISVNLAGLQDGTGTDDQTLTLTGTNLAIEDGNTISLAGLADNLGNHTATTGLQMSGFNINNANVVNVGTNVQHQGDNDTRMELTNDNVGFRVGNVPMLRLQEQATGQDQVVVNEASADVDFRVESDGNANMLRVVASNNRIGVGTNSPTSTMDIVGTARVRTLPTGAATDGVLTTDANGNLRQRTLASIQDGTGTDDQTLTFTGTNLTIEDGNTVNLSSLQDGTGTDDQNLTGATLTGTTLQIDIEGGTSTSVNLAGLQDGTGTDDQTLTLTGTNLAIEDGNTVSLSGLADNLGNHTATTGLQMSGFNINNANVVNVGTNVQHQGDTDTRIEFTDDRIILRAGNLRMFDVQEYATGQDQVVVNEASADIDFRVESDGNANMLRVVASNNRIGVGTNSPTSTMDIVGTARVRTLPTGAATDGVLTTDANGNLRQRTLASIQDGTGTDDQTLTFTGTNLTIEDGNTISLAGLADNLGNHTATTGLQMSGFNINNANVVNVGTNVQHQGDADTRIEFTPDVLRLRVGNVSMVELIESATGQGIITINQPGVNTDFRIEGDTDPNALMVDASTNRIGLGVGIPTAKLDVNGNARVRTLPAGAVADQIVTADANGNLRKRTVASIIGVSNDPWELTGNAGTSPVANYIGTSDNVDLVIKRNNVVAGYFDHYSLSMGVNANPTNSGSYNTAIGGGAMGLMAGAANANNTAIGFEALKNNDASDNTAVGHQSLLANTTGTHNTAVGFHSMNSNTSGQRNTSLGKNSMMSIETGTDNVAIGYQAMENGGVAQTTSIAIGNEALMNHAGGSNIAIGFESMQASGVELVM